MITSKYPFLQISPPLPTKLYLPGSNGYGLGPFAGVGYGLGLLICVGIYIHFVVVWPGLIFISIIIGSTALGFRLGTWWAFICILPFFYFLGLFWANALVWNSYKTV